MRCVEVFIHVLRGTDRCGMTSVMTLLRAQCLKARLLPCPVNLQAQGEDFNQQILGLIAVDDARSIRPSF